MRRRSPQSGFRRPSLTATFLNPCLVVFFGATRFSTWLEKAPGIANQPAWPHRRRHGTNRQDCHSCRGFAEYSLTVVHSGWNILLERQGSRAAFGGALGNNALGSALSCRASATHSCGRSPGRHSCAVPRYGWRMPWALRKSAPVRKPASPSEVLHPAAPQRILGLQHSRALRPHGAAGRRISPYHHPQA